MKVSREGLDRYGSAVDQIAEMAGEAAREAYEVIRASDLNAPVADTRNALIDACNAIVEAYGNGSSEVAASFYDLLAEDAEADVRDADPATMNDNYFDSIDSGVRYIVGKLIPEREDI